MLQKQSLRLIEKSLCLLGSGSAGLTTLHRIKVLAYINKDKVHLAKQSYPNAGRLLFGKDLGDNAKKESEAFVSLDKPLNPQERQYKYGRGQSSYRGSSSSSSCRGPSPLWKGCICKKPSKQNRQKPGLPLQEDQQVKKHMNQVGQISKHLDKWQTVSKDPFISDTVKNAYTIEFADLPRQETVLNSKDFPKCE